MSHRHLRVYYDSTLVKVTEVRAEPSPVNVTRLTLHEKTSEKFNGRQQIHLDTRRGDKTICSLHLFPSFNISNHLVYIKVELTVRNDQTFEGDLVLGNERYTWWRRLRASHSVIPRDPCRQAESGSRSRVSEVVLQHE